MFLFTFSRLVGAYSIYFDLLNHHLWLNFYHLCGSKGTLLGFIYIISFICAHLFFGLYPLFHNSSIHFQYQYSINMTKIGQPQNHNCFF